MRQAASIWLGALLVVANVGLASARADEPVAAEVDPDHVPDHPDKESRLRPTGTEALMKFFLFDRTRKEPIAGIVVALTGPDGAVYYTEETDADGCADLLVPVGQEYDLRYLSLGRREIQGRVAVQDKPNLTFRHTLRYRSREPRPTAPEPTVEPGYVLHGVTFDTGEATLRLDSLLRLEDVLEFLIHKPDARVEISGHTDDVGDAEANQRLSLARGEACRAYLVERGVDPDRIETVGYGEARPLVTNDSPEGRRTNRRIEVRELR